MAAPFCALRPELRELLTETRTALADARRAMETLPSRKAERVLFARHIVALRRITGLTQDEFASVARLHLDALVKYENGARMPHPKTFQKILEGAVRHLKQMHEVTS